MVMHLTLTQNIEVRFFYPLPIFRTACRLFVQVSEHDGEAPLQRIRSS
jgi:hypothetical protein